LALTPALPILRKRKGEGHGQQPKLQSGSAELGSARDPLPFPRATSVAVAMNSSPPCISPRRVTVTWGTFPNSAASAGASPFGFHGFVKMKGGEYFFAPSITFLKKLVS